MIRKIYLIHREVGMGCYHQYYEKSREYKVSRYYGGFNLHIVSVCFCCGNEVTSIVPVNTVCDT